MSETEPWAEGDIVIQYWSGPDKEDYRVVRVGDPDDTVREASSWARANEIAREEAGGARIWFRDVRARTTDPVSGPAEEAARSLHVVILPQTCPTCERPFEVHCRKVSGFGVMAFHRFECPYCHQGIHELLPSEIVDVVAVPS